MSSATRLAFLIGAILIVTASLLIHRAETTFAQLDPICWQCDVLGTGAIALLRDECDVLAGGVGVLRPLDQRDSIEGLPRCFGGGQA